MTTKGRYSLIIIYAKVEGIFFLTGIKIKSSNGLNIKDKFKYLGKNSIQ